MTTRWRIILLIFLAAVAVLLGFVFTRNLIDFPIYYISGTSLRQGRRNIYSPMFSGGPGMAYRYPPFFLLIALPLSMIPYKVAAFLWYTLSLLKIAGCVSVTKKLIGELSRLKPVWIIAFFAVAQYFVMNLRYGNAQLLVVFLMFASLYLALKRKDTTASALMALSISIKLTPVLILPYFALKRRWRFLILTAAFLVPINLAPAAYFGFGQNIDLLKTWHREVVLDQDFHELNGPINLSLKGQFRRYLTEVDYSQRVLGDTRYASINAASLSPRLADRIWMITATAVYLTGCALIFFFGRYKGPEKEGTDSTISERELLETSLMISLMLFVGPLTSKIYFIALLWPVVCLACFAWTHTKQAATFAKRALILIAAVNSVLPLLPGRSTQRMLLVVGVDFYMNCLLLAALGFALICHRRALEARYGEPRIQSLSEARTS